MNHFGTIFLMMALFSPLIAEKKEESIPLFIVEDEVVIIDRLIEATENQLESHKKLKKMMEEFKKQKEMFAIGQQSKERAWRMVRMASGILSAIESENLQRLFDASYLEELAFFSSIADKNSPRRS